ncbi:hypothetical protein G6Z92_06230 [Vibrio aestuarianus subsp. cardii]|uniref:hypothetical protein n=1 Tax=Vibrio aestuarianus TaxID=28171 RepID=UPI0015C53DFE|nr:hypothetical protein [Vibrio aestuarianus]NGZ66582.1 hypothetical protein [Vibrio aestuarianus subsp. cardii]
MTKTTLHYTTEELALHMAKTGSQYTASTLAKELGLTSQFVTGKLNNLEKCRKKYKMEIGDSSPRLYRCLSVKGQVSHSSRKILNSVWL